MLRSSHLAIFGLVLPVLAACETTPPAMAASDTPAPVMVPRSSDYGIGKTIVWGRVADLALADEAKLIEALERFDVPRNNRPLHAWISAIRGSELNPGMSRKLSGLGGAAARAFLDVAYDAVKPGGPGLPAPYVTTGQLVDYAYDADGTQAGWDLRLVVEMSTHRPLPNDRLQHVRSYRWTVKVVDGGVRKIAKDLSNPGDVFPGTKLSIPASAAAGFYWKLYAEGPADIVVERIDRRDGNGVWHELQPKPPSPNPHPLYLLDADACLDIMFPGEPPATLAADAAPPQYCLGRCSSPPLLNTK